MAKVKICGITNLEDAIYAAEHGADALGFIFYKKSPRYVTPQKAKEIIDQLPKRLKKVGVFVNSREATIRKIARDLRLDMLQFHGSESEGFCNRFNGFKIIKAFRIKNQIALVDLSRYNVWAFLFDSFCKSKFGGTGKSFNWQILKGLRGIKQTIFLSGGLNSQNIKLALKSFCGDWVDACSSLEQYPGKKNLPKVKKFISSVKSR